MAKLNQIIAIEKGTKSRTYAVLSEVHKLFQKADLFGGFVRTYRPKADEDDRVPNETKRVQSRVDELLKIVQLRESEHMKVTARKDWTNMAARADVKVGDVVVLSSVPVTYLLYLEKQLTDLKTMLAVLPVLDESENWTLDEGSGLYNSASVETIRTKKVSKPVVLLAPTEHHPGSAQMVSEDVVAGYWTAVKQSGAIPRKQRLEMVERAEALHKAIVEAREAANGADEVESPDVGKAVFGYLLGK